MITSLTDTKVIRQEGGEDKEHHEIIRAACESKADVIIVGARGLGQIGGLLLSSVSERVLHGAHIPVLVVR